MDICPGPPYGLCSPDGGENKVGDEDLRAFIISAINDDIGSAVS
jgi:hypothetical protein